MRTRKNYIDLYGDITVEAPVGEPRHYNPRTNTGGRRLWGSAEAALCRVREEAEIAAGR